MASLRTAAAMGVWWATALACAGGEVVAPDPAPVDVEPAPAPSGPKKGQKRGGGKAGDSVGDLVVDGKSRPVMLDGSKLSVGPWSTTLAEAPFQTVLVPSDKRPSVVVQYETIDDFGRVEVYSAAGGKLERIWQADSMANSIESFSGGFSASSGNCGQKTVVTVKLDGAKITEDKVVTGTFDGGQCAACPFVDVEIDGRWRTVGEILRNLRDPSLEATQSLDLPLASRDSGRIVVRLAERKPETTYLDALWLEVGDVWFAPVGCAAGPECRLDGRPLVLEEGEHRTFVFDIGDTRGTPVLWAHGYYVPTDGAEPTVR